jgi:hypothetical protein
MRIRFLAGTGICALLLLIGSAGIASAKARPLQIVSPHAASVFTAARRVPIKVRVPARGGRFTATLTGRTTTKRITKRFGRAHGDVRTAQLVVGRDLQWGINELTVQAGRTTRTREIVAARPTRGLVRVQRFLRHRRGTQCLCVRATFEDGLGSAQHPLAGFEAMLNGRIVTNQFWQRAPRQRAALLGARMGLRYGRNTIIVLVFDGDGHYDRVTSSIVVPRTLPLASAGFDRRVRPRQRVRLNGTGSIPTRRGQRLRYRWRIVNAPKGSHARLRRAASARPVLVPDVRGDYQVKLTVVGSKRRARARGGRRHAVAANAAASSAVVASATASAAGAPANASAASSTSALPTFVPLSSSDPLSSQPSPPGALPTPLTHAPTQPNSAVVTLSASPEIPPMGCAINTNPAPGWGVTIDGTGCPTLPPKGSSIKSGGGVQLVVLNRGNLHVDKNVFFSASDSTDWQQLSNDVAGTYSSQLVVLSGVDRPASYSQTAINAINYSLGVIGGTGGLNASMPAMRSGAWSAIGWRDLGSGSANQDFAQNAGASGDTGNLSGYLQSDPNNSYVFVHSDYIPFDTSASSTAARNTIRVGQQTVASRTIPAGDSGFQVLAFNGYALGSPTLSQTFITNTPQGPLDSGIQRMAAALSQAAANPSWLVIVQSIGKPAVSPAWVSQLTPQITRLGANWNVFNGLDGKESEDLDGTPIAGSAGYALVGGAGSDAAAAEQSGPLTHTAGQLSGILARNNNNRLVVLQDATSDDIVTNLMPLAFSPGQPWPVPKGVTPAAAAAANRYIAQQLFKGQYATVQDAYISTSMDWTSKALQLQNDVKPPEGGSADFSSADFTAVQSELETQFTMVADVRALVESWRNVFATNAASNLVDLQRISSNIQEAVDPPSSGGISFDPMELIQGLTEVASLAGEVGHIPGVGAMASIYRLASSIATMTTASGDVPVTQQIQTTADQMGWQLADTYTVIQKSLNHVADLLVTNYGRLVAADQHASGDWNLTDSIQNQIGVDLKMAAKQMAYEGMVPLAYPTAYDLRPTGLNRSGTSAQQYRCMRTAGFGSGVKYPFGNTSPLGAFMGIGGVDGNGNYIVDANVLSDIPGDAWVYNQSGQIATGVSTTGGTAPAPPGDLLEKMFDPISEGGQVGLYPQYFFTHFRQRPVACTSTGR